MENERPIQKLDPQGESGQVQHLAAVRKRRNKAEEQAARTELKRLAQGSENVMPGILQALRAALTLGEISDIFREIYGEYRPA